MDLRADAKVLLIRLSAMGDVLFSLETLAALKSERPDVRADFLVEDRFAALLRDHPQVDRLLVYPRRQKRAIPRALRELRAVRYDAVLDLHGNLKSALHARAARTGLRLGYAAPIAREGAERFYDRAVALPEPRPHRAEQGYWLLRALGLHGAPSAPALPTWPQLAAGEAFDVVLHPGTSEFARFKRWPPARFGELARRLSAAGVRVAATLGPGEAAIAAELRAHAPELAMLDGGALGFARLAAHWSAARVVVAADTGPLHLAAAAGTRVVALFGPKDPRVYGPRGEGHRIVLHDVPCRPCTRRDCPSPLCVLGVEVAEVESAVHAALARARTA
jgi:ADP-heptose:LPS heptosyltransferase